MTTPWNKRLFKFSKKLVATLKRVIVSPKGMTELGLPTSAISKKESLKIKNE